MDSPVRAYAARRARIPYIHELYQRQHCWYIGTPKLANWYQCFREEEQQYKARVVHRLVPKINCIDRIRIQLRDVRKNRTHGAFKELANSTYQCHCFIHFLTVSRIA